MFILFSVPAVLLLSFVQAWVSDILQARRKKITITYEPGGESACLGAQAGWHGSLRALMEKHFGVRHGERIVRIEVDEHGIKVFFKKDGER